MKNKKTIFIELIIMFLIILLDQITKNLIINKNDIIIIPNLLIFSYAKNTGIAFSIGENNTIFTIILGIFLLVISLIFSIFFINKKRYYISMCISLIIGGGVGNLVDKTAKGYVIDFINVKLFDFPIFNVADVFITVGIFLLGLKLVKDSFYDNNNCKCKIKTK